MGLCLSRDQIEGYLSGHCSDTDRSIIGLHLSSCSKCRERFNACRSENEFITKWASVSRSTSEPTCTLPTRDDAEMRAGDPPEERTVRLTVPGFTDLEFVGDGSHGTVYRAIATDSGEVVAIKTLAGGLLAHRQHKERFEREPRLLQRLNHPCIVAVHDVNLDYNPPYFALDYVDGLSPCEYAKTNKLRIDDVLRLFLHICEAVAAAHTASILLRDLKPSNILVDQCGMPHLLDFGLAKEIGDGETATAVTASHAFIGTLAYASPEHFQGDSRRITKLSDLYSLAVILYEMLTGVLPYELKGQAADDRMTILHLSPVPPSRHRPGLSEEIDTILLRALAKDPERRYGSVQEFAADIKRYLAGEAIRAKRDSAAYRIRKTLAFYKAALVVTTVMIGFLITLLVVRTSLLRTAEFERSQAQEAHQNAEEQRQIAQQQRSLAEQRELAVNQRLYAGDMNLAFQAWKQKDLIRTWELLEGHLPAPSGVDRRGFEWYYLWRLSNNNRFSISGQAGPAAVSKDGETLVTCNNRPLKGEPPRITAWDLVTGRRKAIFSHATAYPGVLATAFAPDGGQLATAGYFGHYRLWDIATGEGRQLWENDRNIVRDVAFSSDGGLAATVSGSLNCPAKLRLWDVRAGRVTCCFSIEGCAPDCVAFSPDGNCVATGSFDGRVNIRSLVLQR